MKTATYYVTSDGQPHPTKASAEKHARGRYDNAMSDLLKKLTAQNHARIGPRESLILTEFIEGSFDEIARLAALRDDIALSENSGDLEL